MKKNLYEYQGAIFDLDGTLADSMDLWDTLCRDWLLAEGKIPEENLEANIACIPLQAAAQYVIRSYGLEYSPEEILAQWEDLVLERYKTRVPLKEETAALVKELYGKGLKLAIVTSSFPAACEGFLERHKLRHCFSALLYADGVAKDKRFPSIWQEAARRLGLESAACIVFEDAYHAVSGVRAAGMGLAAVYDKHCKAWGLMKAQADWIVGAQGRA
ncbi:MAG: HAD family phosphatase [Treponema sp.]|jgi:HAD superfamily hydrolase (TIGR01509 family)|nr:HAD family phosphatase [Treponema sp.]